MEALTCGTRRMQKSFTDRLKIKNKELSEMTDKKTLTVAEAIAVLGISRTLAYRLIKDGKLPVIRLGKRVLIPVSALEKILTAETV